MTRSPAETQRGTVLRRVACFSLLGRWFRSTSPTLDVTPVTDQAEKPGGERNQGGRFWHSLALDQQIIRDVWRETRL